MHFGLMTFATDYAMRIDELARAAEARDFESLWLAEHTHIPTCRRSPWPGGGELPKEYWHAHDPFVALAMAAAVTTKLKVATGICLIIERDTITTAKEVASLDFLSNGRFLFGIGGGWNAEEMENHGTDFKTRWRRMREQVAAMKKIWTEEAPEYHGKFVNFDPLWMWPKPVQRPHPPVILGGHTSFILDRVVEFCDGWMPLPDRVPNFMEDIKELRRRAEKSGRDPRSISIMTFGCPLDAAVIDQYRAAGIERVTFGIPSAGRDKVLPLMDHYAEFVRQVSGAGGQM